MKRRTFIKGLLAGAVLMMGPGFPTPAPAPPPMIGKWEGVRFAGPLTEGVVPTPTALEKTYVTVYFNETNTYKSGS